MKETKQMKKLMIAAAAAAMIGGAYADSQFYTFSATVKTTKMAKFSGKKTYCGMSVYRTQTTKKFAGAIWGCNCETIMVENEAGWRPNEINDLFSAALWDLTDKTPMKINTFKWDFIQRFGNDGKKVEGLFGMKGIMLTKYDNKNNEYGKLRLGEFALAGAGFGKVSLSKCTSNKYLDPDEFEYGGMNYVSSMSGNLIGYLPAENTIIRNCTWCKDQAGVEAPTAWELCNCCNYQKDTYYADANGFATTICVASKDDYRTAASGSWSIKYNSTASNKLKKLDRTAGDTVLDAYKFPTYAQLYLIWELLGVIPTK